MRTFTLICEVERQDVRSAIDLTEQLVEHGYVDTARVQDDGDGTYVPEAELNVGVLLHERAQLLDLLAALRGYSVLTADDIQRAEAMLIQSGRIKG